MVKTGDTRFRESGVSSGKRQKRFGMNTVLHCAAHALAFLLFSLLCTSGVAWAQSDRETLEGFYSETGGDSWTNSNNWNGGNIPEATNLNDLHGVTADSDGRVTDLILQSNNLSGQIPGELGQLSSLTQLLLDDNQLSGSIPTELGNLTGLQYLFLNQNQLSGSIPTELGNLTGLQYLFLNQNQLSGSIPTELGNLTGLLSLNLYGNQLSGEIPTELGSLTYLQFLYLHGNQLSGQIPAELAQLTNLARLFLNQNQLSGEIPTELGSLTGLLDLFLSNNQLSGEIPTELGSLTGLLDLFLSNNQLSGEIPTELGSLTDLWRLFLNGNQLSGEIPTELGSLTYLQRLFLNQNQLSGEIPTELGSLTYLQRLFLNQNQLSGEIPTELGSLTYLQRLFLSNNQLTGMIPLTELEALRSLQELALWGNGGLTGNISDELGKRVDRAGLRTLYDYNNGRDWNNREKWLPILEDFFSFSGWYGVDANGDGRVSVLDLANNNLSGEITDAFEVLSDLETLDLSNNAGLIGVLPEGLMNLSNLTELNIRNTAIGTPDTPEFQAWLQGLGNGFTGPAPPPPSVTSVSLTSDPGSEDTYAIGDSIRATVTFSGEVDVSGTPQLELDVDGSPKQAGYESGTGTATLVCSYTVAEDDKAPSGVAIGADNLARNGGTITKSGDSAVDAILTHGAVAIDSAHKVDGVRPTLEGAVTSTDGTKVILTFSENIAAAAPTNTPFTVKVNDVSVSLGGVPSVSNREVTLRLTAAVTTGQAVMVSYTDPISGNDANAVQDTVGNDADSFSDQEVTNAAIRIPQTGSPNTGSPDTGSPDTGSPDTGSPDTGSPDTGSPDTGSPDTGSLDTGNEAHLDERRALLALYQATGGEDWEYNANWNTDAPVGTWHGVTVDSEGRVIELDLAANGLSGEIPPSLVVNLLSLRRLYLNDNRLSAVPLAQLRDLLEGPDPALEELALWGNDLLGGTGNISVELDRRVERAALRALYEGSGGPRWKDTDSWLDETNPFSFSEWYGVIMTDDDGRVVKLDLSDNGLSGELGGELESLGTLYSLDLSRNPDLNGELPRGLMELTELFVVNIEDTGMCAPGDTEFNQWLGTIGFQGNTCADDGDRLGLEALYLTTGGENWTDNTNWLVDSKPPSQWYGVSVDSQGRVTGIDLSDNGLSGLVPLSLMNLSKLQTLNIEGTGACAPDDAEFQQWLATMDFRGNVCEDMDVMEEDDVMEDDEGACAIAGSGNTAESTVFNLFLIMSVLLAVSRWRRSRVGQT